jgi:hypothetical protein
MKVLIRHAICALGSTVATDNERRYRRNKATRTFPTNVDFSSPTLGLRIALQSPILPLELLEKYLCSHILEHFVGERIPRAMQFVTMYFWFALSSSSGKIL